MLIKPINLHGAPICTPSMDIIKHISKFAQCNEHTQENNILNKFNLVNCEKVHLIFFSNGHWELIEKPLMPVCGESQVAIL